MRKKKTSQENKALQTLNLFSIHPTTDYAIPPKGTYLDGSHIKQTRAKPGAALQTPLSIN